MRKLLIILTLMAIGLAAGNVDAKNIDVQMLNKGDKGRMVFQPDLVIAAPGDTVTFLPTTKGHNVESIKSMLPDGVDKFKGKFNKEFVLTVTEKGMYGVKCLPHYTMGMVALIVVGNPENEDAVKAAKNPEKAQERFTDIFAEYDAMK